MARRRWESGSRRPRRAKCSSSSARTSGRVRYVRVRRARSCCSASCRRACRAASSCAGEGLSEYKFAARATAAVESWAVVHGPGPAKGDEGAGERLPTARGVEDKLGQDAGKQAEGAFDVGIVLRTQKGRANLERVAPGPVRRRGGDWRGGCLNAGRAKGRLWWRRGIERPRRRRLNTTPCSEC